MDAIKGPTVPARILAVIEEMEREYPGDSVQVRLDVWSHRGSEHTGRVRTAAYTLWSDDHRISVSHSDPTQLPRLIREELKSKIRTTLAPEPVAEPEVPINTESMER